MRSMNKRVKEHETNTAMQIKAQRLLQLTSQAWGLQYTMQPVSTKLADVAAQEAAAMCQPQRNIATATLGIVAAARATMQVKPAAHSPALRMLWR